MKSNNSFHTVCCAALFALVSFQPAASADETVEPQGIIGIGTQGIIGIGAQGDPVALGIIGIGNDIQGIIGIGADAQGIIGIGTQGIIGIGNEAETQGIIGIGTQGIIGIGNEAETQGIIGIGTQGIIGIGTQGIIGIGAPSEHMSIGTVESDEVLLVNGTVYDTGGVTLPRGSTAVVYGSRDASGLTGVLSTAGAVPALQGVVDDAGRVLGVPVSFADDAVNTGLFGSGASVALHGHFTGSGFLATRVDPATGPDSVFGSVQPADEQTTVARATGFHSDSGFLADSVQTADPSAGLADGASVSIEAWLDATTPARLTLFGLTLDLAQAERFGDTPGLYRLEGVLQSGTVTVETVVGSGHDH